MLNLLRKRPSAAEVARRLVILKYQVVHALAAPPQQFLGSYSPEERSTLTATFGEFARQMCASLRAAGLWSKLSSEEKTFFSTPAPSLEPQMHLDATWRAEAAGCLLWALRLLPELPKYDSQIDPELLKPIAAGGVREFVAHAALRSAQEIDRARDIAELWHWRARTRQLQEQGVTPPANSGFESLQEIAYAAAARAADAGEIPQPVDGDFPAFGKSYSALDSDEWSIAQSIASERHFAFNWMCGRARRNRWEDTPTDT